MTSRVEKYVAEALETYSVLRHEHGKLWVSFMRRRMIERKWKVSHPGADKYVAIKGNVVVKWTGKCRWSDNAIRDELELHEVLQRAGLGRFLPKLYANCRKELLVEQFINGYVDCEQAEMLSDTLEKNGIRVTDIHSANVKAFMGRPKLIDGRLGDYDGEDGNGYSDDYDEENSSEY